MDKKPKNKFASVNKLGILFLIICITPLFDSEAFQFKKSLNIMLRFYISYYNAFLGKIGKTKLQQLTKIHLQDIPR